MIHWKVLLQPELPCCHFVRGLSRLMAYDGYRVVFADAWSSDLGVVPEKPCLDQRVRMILYDAIAPSLKRKSNPSAAYGDAASIKEVGDQLKLAIACLAYDQEVIFTPHVRSSARVTGVVVREIIHKHQLIGYMVRPHGIDNHRTLLLAAGRFHSTGISGALLIERKHLLRYPHDWIEAFLAAPAGTCSLDLDDIQLMLSSMRNTDVRLLLNRVRLPDGRNPGTETMNSCCDRLAHELFRLLEEKNATSKASS